MPRRGPPADWQELFPRAAAFYFISYYKKELYNA